LFVSQVGRVGLAHADILVVDVFVLTSCHGNSLQRFGFTG
jgi:hypothetical protein